MDARRTATRLLVLTLALPGSGCAPLLPTLAPAAADRPQLWVEVLNRSADGASVAFAGETGGRGSSGSIDVPSCFGGAWNFPTEAAWTLTVNGRHVAQDPEPRAHPTMDLVATIEIAPGGDVSLTSLEYGERPRDAGDLC